MGIASLNAILQLLTLESLRAYFISTYKTTSYLIFDKNQLAAVRRPGDPARQAAQKHRRSAEPQQASSYHGLRPATGDWDMDQKGRKSGPLYGINPVYFYQHADRRASPRRRGIPLALLDGTS